VLPCGFLTVISLEGLVPVGFGDVTVVGRDIIVGCGGVDVVGCEGVDVVVDVVAGELLSVPLSLLGDLLLLDEAVVTLLLS